MAPYLIVTGDFVRTGGMDRANLALAEYLARTEREVHLVAYRAAKDLVAGQRVRFHRVPKPLGAYGLAAPLLDLAGRAAARTIARRGGTVVVNGGNCACYDVNWVHHIHSATRPYAGVGLKARLKTEVNYRLALRNERVRLPRARLIITSTRGNRQALIDRVRVEPSRVHHVYYGVDREFFRPRSASDRQRIRSEHGWGADAPLAIFVGALGDRRKGFDLLFAAWSRLCAEPGWNGKLLVVGRGADVAHWQAETRRARLTPFIEFLGFVPNLGEIVGACDALVLPSRYEGYSLVALEALAAGVPAFVSRSSGIAERYSAGMQPLLIDDPEDTHALFEKLRSWYPQRNTWRQAMLELGEPLRNRTWDDMAREIVELIDASRTHKP